MKNRVENSTPPYLRSITLLPENVEPGQFPFSIPAFAKPFRLELKTPVTFLVGENGSGKSTLLEAIAQKCGFNLRGGNKNHLYAVDEELSPLAEASTRPSGDNAGAVAESVKSVSCVYRTTAGRVRMKA